MGTFNKTHLLHLKGEHAGHNIATTSDTLDHLHEYYGKITDNDLVANKDNMTKEWDLDTPIQTLHKKTEEGDKFSKIAGETMQDKEKISI